LGSIMDSASYNNVTVDTGFMPPQLNQIRSHPIVGQ